MLTKSLKTYRNKLTRLAISPFEIRWKSFWFGFLLPFTSLKLVLTKPKLLFWSTLPILLTLVLYIYGIERAQDFLVATANQYFESLGIDLAGFWGTILSWIVRLTLIMLGVLTFAFASSIIASPFNDILAERTERYSIPPLPRAPLMTLREQLGLIWVDVLKTLIAATAAIFALILSWVPIINFFAFSCAFLLLTYQYISYPQTRRKIGPLKGALFLGRHFFSCLGYGVAFSMLFTIPIVSSFVIPLAVISGTLLVGRASDKQHPLL